MSSKLQIKRYWLESKHQTERNSKAVWMPTSDSLAIQTTGWTPTIKQRIVVRRGLPNREGTAFSPSAPNLVSAAKNEIHNG
jgi:hypothetical protein